MEHSWVGLNKTNLLLFSCFTHYFVGQRRVYTFAARDLIEGCHPSFSPMQPAFSSIVLSFIVPAYNEEQLPGQTLESIHGASQAIGEPYQETVVDHGSTDQTSLVAPRQRAMVVAVEHRKIFATRNSGAEVATGDFFFFVDADTVADRQVVQAAIDVTRRISVLKKSC